MKVYSGEEIGVKTSSAPIRERCSAEDLIAKQLLGTLSGRTG